MTTKDTGDWVFHDASVYLQHPSMTLRDYFAAQALPAIVAATSNGQHQLIPNGTDGVEALLARDAYKLADAMLEARKA